MSENDDLLRRLDSWNGDEAAGPLIRWAAAHLRECINASKNTEAYQTVPILKDYKVRYGEVLCASCGHAHSEGAWSDRDLDDGTCWNAGSLVCGCQKFITPSVKRMREARYKREHGG